MREVPVADPDELRGFSRFVSSWLRANLPQARNIPFEEWLESTSFNDARKQELRVAWMELKGGRPTRWQCRRVKSFVKTESYECYKQCRMINSRCDAFKAYSGRFFKAIEEVVYALPEFIKHTPVPERPAKVAALKQAGRRYYATDFTAYESHFVPALMQACELALYRHCLQWCPDDAELLCAALSGDNCMSTHTGIKAVIKARRMSGDMCTSLGNGFTNLMLVKYLCWKQGAVVDGFVEGDDGLFSTQASLTSEGYKKLGFTIKIEEITDPSEASFCGMIFAESGEIIRSPLRFLSNFGWTSSTIGAGSRIMDGLLRAKALSSVYETPQCPIVGSVARYALSVTEHVAPRWVDDGFHHCPRDTFTIPKFSPSPDTRALFAEKFGISVQVQLDIEKRAAAGDFDFLSLLSPHPDAAHFAARYLDMG